MCVVQEEKSQQELGDYGLHHHHYSHSYPYAISYIFHLWFHPRCLKSMHEDTTDKVLNYSHLHTLYGIKGVRMLFCSAWEKGDMLQDKQKVHTVPGSEV